ncbi:MAG: YceI family protein [Bacteroidia bacterium]
MYKFFTAIFVVSFVACTQAPQAPQAITSEAQADSSQATSSKEGQSRYTVTKLNIKWTGTKVTGRHEGIIPVTQATLEVQNGQITNGAFLLSVKDLQVTDLQGKEKQKLESHLKSEDFLAVDSFPECTLEITRVETISGTPECPSCNAQITGELSLRGVVKKITFPATITSQPGKVTAQASFNINRFDWNIRYQGRKDDLIRPEVNIQIYLEAEEMRS